MKVKIFYGTPKKVEKDVNAFIDNMPVQDIHKIQTVGFSAPIEGLLDLIAVLIWTRE